MILKCCSWDYWDISDLIRSCPCAALEPMRIQGEPPIVDPPSWPTICCYSNQTSQTIHDWKFKKINTTHAHKSTVSKKNTVFSGPTLPLKHIETIISKGLTSTTRCPPFRRLMVLQGLLGPGHTATLAPLMQEDLRAAWIHSTLNAIYYESI